MLIYFDNNIPEFTAVYLNGERLNLQNERLVRGVIELGFLPQGEAVVSLTVSGDTRWYSGLCAASFNTEAFDQLISTLQKSAPNTLSVSKTFWGEPVVSGKFNAPRNGALFTSIPADCGWSAEIDGQKVSPIATGMLLSHTGYTRRACVQVALPTERACGRNFYISGNRHFMHADVVYKAIPKNDGAIIQPAE